VTPQAVLIDVRSVLQHFTTPEEERLETLSSTVGPTMDIASRFMTAHGELVKTVLWDTGELVSHWSAIRV
jgi:hypothetical protein